MIRLASQYGRYGYRRITALLKAEGWQVNHKRVERLVKPTCLAPRRAAPSAHSLGNFSDTRNNGGT